MAKSKLYCILVTIENLNIYISLVWCYQISVSYPFSYLYCSPSLDSELSSESEKQSKLYLALGLSISASHHLTNFWLTWVLTIRCLLVEFLGALGFLVIQGLRAPCLGHLNLPCRLQQLLQLLLVVTIPVFFFLLIFAEGAIWPPSTIFCFRTSRWLPLSFGFLLYGRFWAGDTGWSFSTVI